MEEKGQKDGLKETGGDEGKEEAEDKDDVGEKGLTDGLK